MCREGAGTEQAAALAQEELDRLYELGVLPDGFNFSDAAAIDVHYLMLCDRDDRQKSVSLWVMSMSKNSAYYAYGDACTLIMDAQTGLIYSLRLILDGTPEFSLEDVAHSWGTYLELGVPTVQEKYESLPGAGDTGTVSWVVPSYQTLSVAYETDDGTVPYYFWLEQDPNLKSPTSTLIITPFSPSSGL